MRNDDPFSRFAAAGLAMLFGLQSTINMAVNLHLMPAKGMTLPFISYGGSSLDFARLRHGHAGGADPRAAARTAAGRDRDCREPGVMQPADRAPRRRFCWRPAAPAAICFRPRRWRRRSPRAASKFISPPTAARRAMAAHSPKTRSMSFRARRCAARNPIAMARTAALLGVGLVQACALVGRLRPAAVDRLRRLSDHPAGAGGVLARRSQPYS